MRKEEDFAAGSIIGDRSAQEDSFGFLVKKRSPGANPETGAGGAGALLAALADGMGGHECGEIASRAACEHFLRAIEKSRTVDSKALVSAADAANAAILELARSNPKCAGMGCTLVGVGISAGNLGWLSVGDSHLYLFRGGALTKLNDDHSLAPVLDRLVEKGELNEGEARTHPDRNSLRSALYGEMLSLIDCPATPFPLKNDDIIVLASDEVDVLNYEELGSVVSNQRRQSARQIVEAVLDRVRGAKAANQDNAAVMVVKISAAAHDTATRPFRMRS